MRGELEPTGGFGSDFGKRQYCHYALDWREIAGEMASHSQLEPMGKRLTRCLSVVQIESAGERGPKGRTEEACAACRQRLRVAVPSVVVQPLSSSCEKLPLTSRNRAETIAPSRLAFTPVKVISITLRRSNGGAR